MMRAAVWLCAMLAWLGAGGRAGEIPRLRLDTGGHMAVVRGLAFSPDGSELYTAGRDKSVRVWDTKTGECRRVLRGQGGKGSRGHLETVAISPSGNLLAVGGILNPKGSDEVPVRLLDSRTGAVLALLEGHRSTVNKLAFSPDGRRLASASHDYTVRIWNVEAALRGPDAPRVCSGHTAAVYGLAWSPDSRQLASAGDDGRLILWDALTGEEVRSATAGEGVALRCAFAPDGRWIATSGEDGTLKLWDPRTLRSPQTVIRVKDGFLAALAFSPDSRLLASGGRYLDAEALRCPIFLHDPASGELVRMFRGHTNSVQAIAFSPDGKTVASTGGNDHETLLWDPATGETRQRLVGRGKSVWACAFGDDGRTVFWGTQNRGGCLQASDPITGGFSLEGFRLLSAEEVRAAPYHRVWHEVKGTTIECDRTASPPVVRIAGRKVLWPQHRRNDTLWCCTLTPDGRHAIVGTAFSIYRFDAQTGEWTGEFVGHEETVAAVSVSSDSRRLLSAGVDQTLKLWDVESRELLATLFFSTDGEWVVWTKSGYYAASAGGDRYIGWHVSRGPDQSAEFFRADQFRKVYDWPELVQATLRLGSEQLGLRSAQQTSKRTERIVEPAEIPSFRPPRITFLSPKDGSAVRGDSVTVAYRIESPLEVKETRVTVNGRALQGARNLGLAPKDGQTLTVALDPGLNRITLSAAHEKASASETLEVTREAAPAPAELLPRLFLVAVGVDRYDHLPADRQLQFAGADARETAAAFRSLEGKLFREVRARVLVEGAGDAAPTRERIIDALDLFSKAGQYDTCVLFVAGHGWRGSRNTFYLVPKDGRLGEDGEPLRSSLVSWTQIKDALDVAGRRLLLVDACHAAAAGGVKTRALNTDELVKQFQDASTVVLTSCRGTELSEERPEWGHGAFTKTLLDGLRERKADLVRDGVISIKELDTYVSETVPTLTNGRQHPITFAPRGFENFAIYK